MKRWAFLTVLLYTVCVSVLGIPLYLFLSEEGIDLPLFFHLFLFPVLILVQIILLLVPVAVSQERPVGRRKIFTSAVFGAIPMAFLGMLFVMAVVLMIWGEDTSWDYIYNWPILVVPGVLWLLWGFLFYKNYSADNPNKFTSVVTRWLLKGSILELLVAIPSHVISRHREECCAPTVTFIGIITGLAIALLSFGPGLFFLFAKRIKDKRPKNTSEVVSND